MIAIIAAMDSEINAILNYMEVEKEETVNHLLLHYGKMRGKDVVVCKCGIGKVMAGVATTVVCMKSKPDLIINTGVAGGLIQAEKVLDIVISDKVFQADFDTTEIDGPEGQGLTFESDKRAQETCVEAAKQCGITYHVGDVATQDLFMARDEDYKRVMTLFPSSICAEMEGGAVAQVATAFGIPFVIVRSLSDTIYNVDNAMEYSKYVVLASAQSAKLVKCWIEKL